MMLMMMIRCVQKDSAGNGGRVKGCHNLCLCHFFVFVFLCVFVIDVVVVVVDDDEVCTKCLCWKRGRVKGCHNLCHFLFVPCLCICICLCHCILVMLLMMIRRVQKASAGNGGRVKGCHNLCQHQIAVESFYRLQIFQTIFFLHLICSHFWGKAEGYQSQLTDRQ